MLQYTVHVQSLHGVRPNTFKRSYDDFFSTMFIISPTILWSEHYLKYSQALPHKQSQAHELIGEIRKYGSLGEFLHVHDMIHLFTNDIC